MGEVPDWYVLKQDADWYGVAPWELLEQPLIWRGWARLARRAEYNAHKNKKQVQGGVNGH